MVKISVVMGVFNAGNEAMLLKSINSILSQTESNFEFIICDDGSTDDTSSILHKISRCDNRIKLINNERNIGLAATLNRCIDVASGEYIARQDADDYSMPHRLRRQMEYLDKNKEYAFVGSNIARFDEHGQWGEYKLKEFPEKEDFLFTVPIIHGTVMYRKQALLSSDKYRVAKVTRRTEDYDLFMRMYSKGLKCANIQENLYFVREDKNAYRRRKYRYRIDEAIVRYKGYRSLDLLPRGYVYVVKPLIVGLIPHKILNLLKNMYYGRKNKD